MGRVWTADNGVVRERVRYSALESKVDTDRDSFKRGQEVRGKRIGHRALFFSDGIDYYFLATHMTHAVGLID